MDAKSKVQADVMDVQDSESKLSKGPSDESFLPEEYPEGGRDAIMTVIGALLANIVQFGVVNLVGVLQAQ